jgi:glycosyltransferase involved in cell wall biosynthesis
LRAGRRADRAPQTIMEQLPGILHITAAAGGGVDRFIRDAAATTRGRHFVWHAGESIDVIEDVGARGFVPLRDVVRSPRSAPALDRWRRAEGIGLVHAHGVSRAVRARMAIVDGTVPAIVTLHDVAFIAEHAFDAAEMPAADAAWIADVSADLARVEALTVPSHFIRREAAPIAGGKPIVDVAPGIAPADTTRTRSAPPDFAARAPRHVVAVVGAIGPHKGSALIGDVARDVAPSGIAIVVIGYTNERLSRGWTADDGYFVHGPYLDSELAAWLRAYDVDAVLFPNRLPESFSYTLSEVWAAGLPAIVPDAGALGERVARHGGGWRLPAGFDAAAAAALVRRLFDAPGAAERARVKSQVEPLDAERIPTLAAMSRALDALYARFALPAQPAPLHVGADALSPLLAANLDGFAFRAELLHFAEDLDNARQAIADLQRALADAQQWARTLETNSQAWAAKLERDIRVRDDALDRLPKPLRAWIIRRALRDRG